MKMYQSFHYPSIETERVSLRVLSLDETEKVYKHFSDKNITEYMDIEPCKDHVEAAEIITYHLEDLGCRWGMYDKEYDDFIGTCGFHYIREMEEQVIAEVGYDLAKPFWGKGLMNETMKALIDFGFNCMNLDVIDATVDPQNERSIVLMDRLGFTKAPELVDGLIYFSLKKN
ncbi:GNAT family N-acetyltransferase [Bacillus sp. CGMCC 1.16607]|uniref:GNAT family N-acetyltransferase n=1 Tax=Bacillus sp. CGMCC 1.16607 TaxID=3351842 RepID=UPI003631D738